MKFVTIIAISILVIVANVSVTFYSECALLKNTSTSTTIDQENSHLYFNLRSKNWSYEKSGYQIQTTRRDTDPCIGVLSSHKLHLNHVENIRSDNITNFKEESNKLVWTIKLSSNHEINIKNLTIRFNISIVNEQETSFGHTYGFYLLNESASINDFMSLSWIFGSYPGSLQYLKIGNFILDNRSLEEHAGWVGTSNWKLSNITIPPGNWYFIFYAGIYDVPNDNTLLNTKVSINVSDSPDDLKVIKNEEGEFYSLWYGEFNPRIVLSKTWTFEFMLHGNKQFLINNTFLYQFNFFPVVDGFWRIHWTTPDGMKNCRIRIKNGGFYSIRSDEEVDSCIWGIGGKGRYTLLTQYIDRGNDQWWTTPIYFSAVDVPLN